LVTLELSVKTTRRMNQKIKSRDLQKKLKDLKPLLEEEFGVKEIGYFGSFALGEESESSDVDILVELKAPLGWKFFELKEFLEDKLGRPVDLVTQNALKERLRNEILSSTIYV